MANFQERLLELRTLAKLSQENLGNEAGLSRWAIGSYETGKRRPDFDGLLALADYFDVSIDYLVGRTDKREVNR